MAPAKVGPWGGPGGQAFDDGWDNSGISNVTIYYDQYLRGLVVEYGNGKRIQHGATFGTAVQLFPSSNGFTDISVSIGRHSHFSGNFGVVGLGLSASMSLPVPPATNNVDDVVTVRPHVLGFFGRASAGAIDQIGMYLYNDQN